jgi:hypothetical protein
MAEPKRTHAHFDGITLAPGGQELILEYSDPDQGGTRLRYRYLISLTAPPRLVTGYGPEIGTSGDEIGYQEIPEDVLCDGRDWLRSNVEIARAQVQDSLCSILSEYLKLLEPGENRSRPVPKSGAESPTSQRTFKW